MNPTTLLIIGLTCMLLSPMEGRGIIKKPRCRCVENHKKEIPRYRIKTLDIYYASYICKKDEIIATLKNRQTQICLNPDDQWVQAIIKNNGTSEIKIYRYD